MFKNIAVIGGGSWATAIIKMLLENVDEINWYMRSKEKIKFIEEHKELENTGRGMWFDKEPERDLDIKYKKQDYVLTIRRMEK